ncbi:MAG: hypothetical protein K9J74_14595, partial [Sulfuritalea sp.]|nr:hypothetical protein [Sulfuritalea sp.]
IGLRVINRSPVAQRNVRVAGEVQQTEFARVIVLTSVLRPGKSAVVAMGIRLSDIDGGLKRVRGEGRHADPAE